LGRVTSCKDEGICRIAENGFETVFWFRATETRYAAARPRPVDMERFLATRLQKGKLALVSFPFLFAPRFCVYGGDGTAPMVFIVDRATHFHSQSLWPLKDIRSSSAQALLHLSWPLSDLFWAALDGF
jgi:hypothetical protein